MATPLIPQEIYLLERYSSLSYLGEMRDAWESMLKAGDDGLQEFMKKLPPNYRSQHLSLQPDIVWGERVLENFRATMQSIYESYIELSHGDLIALRIGNGVTSDIVSQSRDYSADWMAEPYQTQFHECRQEAGTRARNIGCTVTNDWTIGDLTDNYDVTRGPLNPPASWPRYRLNPNVVLKTGDAITETGIYLPNCHNSCAALLIKDFFEAPEATVGYDSETMQRLSLEATTWTLVERVSDEGGGIPGDPDPTRAGVRIASEANTLCPKAGYWSSPAKADSRRLFKQGEVMPSLGGDYGLTIWYWDYQQ